MNFWLQNILIIKDSQSCLCLFNFSFQGRTGSLNVNLSTYYISTGSRGHYLQRVWNNVVEMLRAEWKRILKCRKCFAKIKIFYNSTAKIKIIIAQDSSVTLYHFVLNIWRYYEVDLAFYNFCQHVLLFLSINLARQSSLKHIKSFCSAWFCSVMLQQVI